ncbi:MAG: TIM barrel protein [Actinobacteria bacterium]|nr:TIM barrel protein [Actinomycetota bacterium]
MAATTSRYDVNLSILFTELALLDRPGAAADAGFDAVELWWPFDTPTPRDREVDALVRSLADAGVRLVGLNFDAGDMAGGARGLLSDPRTVQRFRDNIDVAVGIAEQTGCSAMNALYGNRVEGVDPQQQDEIATENLTLAARAADRIGAVVLIEALNSYESPRYPLVSSADAIGVLDRVQREGAVDNVALLADLYHLARMGEDPAAVVASHLDRIGHVQIADVPDRHQPGTGDLDLDAVLAALDDGGYAGYIGLEYTPLGPSADSFDWLPREDRAATGTPRPTSTGGP